MKKQRLHATAWLLVLVLFTLSTSVTGSMTFPVDAITTIEGSETDTPTTSGPASRIPSGTSLARGAMISDNTPPPPTATIAPVTSPVCPESGPTSFTVNGTHGAILTYSIVGHVGPTGNQTLTLSPTTGDASIPVFANFSPNPTNITLTLISIDDTGNGNGISTLTQTATITINPTPGGSSVLFGSRGNNFCIGSNTDFQIAYPLNSTLEYSFGGAPFVTLPVSSTSDIFQTISIPVTGSQRGDFLNIKGPYGANGCGNVVQQSIGIYLVEPPTFTFAGIPATPPLSNGSIDVTAIDNFGYGPLFYTLNNDPYTTSSSFTNLPTGTYVVKVKDAAGCDGISQNATVSLKQIVTGNTDINIGYGINSTTLTSNAVGNTGLLWSTGSTASSIQVSPTTTTVYSLTATYPGGNKVKQDVTVKVQDVRCVNNNSGVKMCYQGREVCVAPYLVPTYQRYGGTLGGCQSKVPLRLSYEPTSSERVPVSLSMKPYPNPVFDAVMVQVIAPKAGPAIFEVLDLTGRVRQSRQENLIKGLNEVEFRLGSLPTGVYLIRATDGLNQQAAVRVSKQ